ncbi:conserved protein of unknown function [Tepidanaerobacter acetatoxydans Re1]|uniref:Uncharacterized protein n=1 Tax=Tepidanaerobacter acetatoxydans (strain DSM 21804 / JCM 16047 / Re1) TaxID=1209989 RepID=F4LXG7_TEPAE|nr:hypothetical protein [Tepidanaerobacter acetatoxydans]AEE91069.1 protein of unknown function DUF469 [Tepidanaerobacter acetatoxydans Re1]CCP25697.1 conserved protein of unknown function [Tepidanaerobacter acetatoxydans Re1]
MRKEFEIQGCIEVPIEITEEEFVDRFISFIESNNWWFGGGIREIIDGFYINQDGTKGEHVLNSDLKELISKDKRAEAIELFMNLTGESLKEAERHIDNLSKFL